MNYLTFWKDSFQNIFSATYLLFLIVAGVFSAVYPSGERVLVAGDYPSFYSAGILAYQMPEFLYSLDAQKDLQQMFWPQESGFHVFAYPAFFSFLFIPFSFLSPVFSKFLFISLLLLCTWFCARYLRGYYAESFSLLTVFALLLMFLPNVVGILGGQNNAFSFLILLLLIKLNRERKVYLQGVLFGLWNFKPQYAVIGFIFLFLYEREKVKFLVGYVSISLLQCTIAGFYFGFTIYQKWIEIMFSLGALNQNALDNISRMVSILGSSKVVYLQWGSFGLGIWVLAIASFLVFSAYSYFYKGDRPLPLSIIGPLIVLLSPQTGFYDSVLVLPFFLEVFLCRKEKSLIMWKSLGFIVVSGVFCQVQFVYQVPLFTAFLIFIFGRTLQKL
jgi:hypothetical protein